MLVELYDSWLIYFILEYEKVDCTNLINFNSNFLRLMLVFMLIEQFKAQLFK